jgi:hypothetical protein
LGLQTWVAASTTFQGIVGAANAAAAASSIYLYSAPGNFSASRVIVGPMGRHLKKQTSDNSWLLDGGLFVEFEITQQSYVDASTGVINHNGAGQNFVQQVSAILDDVLPLCGQTVSGTSYLDIVEIEEIGDPTPCDPTLNQGQYFWFTLWKIRHRG